MKKIAVIDDNINFLNAFQVIISLLENTELSIKLDNGLNLLNHPSINQIDFVFIDLNMPEIDGLTLSRKIKLHFPDIKIFIITSNANTLLTEKIKSSEAISLLDKNELDLQSLRKIINSDF